MDAVHDHTRSNPVKAVSILGVHVFTREVVAGVSGDYIDVALGCGSSVVVPQVRRTDGTTQSWPLTPQPHRSAVGPSTLTNEPQRPQRRGA